MVKLLLASANTRASLGLSGKTAGPPQPAALGVNVAIRNVNRTRQAPLRPSPSASDFSLLSKTMVEEQLPALFLLVGKST